MNLHRKQLHWGKHAPDLYTAVHPLKGNKVGIGLLYARQPQDATFNVWLWQNDFVTPADLTYDQAKTFAFDWAICDELAALGHEGTEIGVATLMFSPEKFATFIKGFHTGAEFCGKTYKLRRPVAA